MKPYVPLVIVLLVSALTAFAFVWLIDHFFARGRIRRMLRKELRLLADVRSRLRPGLFYWIRALLTAFLVVLLLGWACFLWMFEGIETFEGGPFGQFLVWLYHAYGLWSFTAGGGADVRVVPAGVLSAAFVGIVLGVSAGGIVARRSAAAAFQMTRYLFAKPIRT